MPSSGEGKEHTLPAGERGWLMQHLLRFWTRDELDSAFLVMTAAHSPGISGNGQEEIMRYLRQHWPEADLKTVGMMAHIGWQLAGNARQPGLIVDVLAEHLPPLPGNTR
jgi:hypothetical protein